MVFGNSGEVCNKQRTILTYANINTIWTVDVIIDICVVYVDCKYIHIACLYYVYYTCIL